LSKERVVDSLDINLMRILEEDSRTPWSRIARRLGVSETTVYLRVKKLTEMGVLEGFTVKINTAKLGLKSTTYILLKVRGDSLEAFRKLVEEDDNVIEAYEVFAGEYNVLLKLIARSQEEMAEHVDRILSLPGIQGALIAYNMKTVKSKPKLLNIVQAQASKGKP
jgi:Lrp/AsnC family transcriptional regulator for asnA, asnC and gidA